MVLRATMAEYASAQSATRSAMAALIHTATCGLRKRGETEATAEEKGSPPSRAKAKSMRELEVTLERPQNHIASIATPTSAFPRRARRAPGSRKRKGLPGACAAPRSRREGVTASRGA